MAERAVQPVFIFLPVTEDLDTPEGAQVDPVCGRVLGGGSVAGRLLHGGKQHYFCSLGCARRFASHPAQYAPR